jgi:hypothetical protein
MQGGGRTQAWTDRADTRMVNDIEIKIRVRQSNRYRVFPGMLQQILKVTEVN